MGEPARPRLPARPRAAQSKSEDDRSRRTYQRGSRGATSPRSFGVGITSSELCETPSTFPCDQRAKTIMDQGSTFLRPRHPLRGFDQLFVEIDCRTHVSTSSDASIVHHVMHIPFTTGRLTRNASTSESLSRSARGGGPGRRDDDGC